LEERRSVEVCNPQGLHARPCHAVVSTALAYRCELHISAGSAEVNGKSILALMTLNACQGTKLELRAVGEGAAELVERLGELFETGFGELESA